jgi:hypothetical protein
MHRYHGIDVGNIHFNSMMRKIPLQQRIGIKTAHPRGERLGAIRILSFMVVAAMITIVEPSYAQQESKLSLSIEGIVPIDSIIYFQTNNALQYRERIIDSTFFKLLKEVNWLEVLCKGGFLEDQHVAKIRNFLNVLNSTTSQEFFNRMLDSEIGLATFPMSLKEIDWDHFYRITSKIAFYKRCPKVERADITMLILGFLQQFSLEWTPIVVPDRDQVIYIFSLPQGRFKIVFSFIDEFMVAGIGENTVRNCLDTYAKKTLSLDQHRVYKSFRSHPVKDENMFFWINGELLNRYIITGINSLLQQCFPDNKDCLSLPKTLVDVVKYFANWKALGFSGQYNKNMVFQARGFLMPFKEQSGEEGRNGIFQCQPKENKTYPLIPLKSAAYFWTSCSLVSQLSISQNKEKAPFALDIVGLSHVKPFLKKAIPTEVSSLLGENLTVYFTGWDFYSESLFSRVAFLFDIKDRKINTPEISRLIGQLNITEKEDFLGQQINTVPRAEESTELTSYAIADHYLIVATDPEPIREIIRVFKKQAKSIEEHQGFKNALQNSAENQSGVFLLQGANLMEQAQAYLAGVERILLLQKNARLAQEKTCLQQLEVIQKDVSDPQKELAQEGRDIVMFRGAGEEDALGSLAALKKIDSELIVKYRVSNKITEKITELTKEQNELLAVKESKTKELTAAGFARIDEIQEELDKLKKSGDKVQEEIKAFETNKTRVIPPSAIQINQLEESLEKNLLKLYLDHEKQKQLQEDIKRLRLEQAMLTEEEEMFKDLWRPLLFALSGIDYFSLIVTPEGKGLAANLDLKIY